MRAYDRVSRISKLLEEKQQCAENKTRKNTNSTSERMCVKIWTEYQLTVDFNVCKLLISNVCVWNIHTHKRAHAQCIRIYNVCTWSLSYFTRTCSHICRPIGACVCVFKQVNRILVWIFPVHEYSCHGIVGVCIPQHDEKTRFLVNLLHFILILMYNRGKT